MHPVPDADVCNYIKFRFSFQERIPSQVEQLSSEKICELQGDFSVAASSSREGVPIMLRLLGKSPA